MVLDRYVFKLWFGVFAGLVVVVTGVLLLGRALKVLGVVAERGVDWSVILLMLMAILPYFLVLTLPIAFFFAMQSVILRLNQDSEMDALRASGISYLRILRPLFGVALLLWLLLSYTAMVWMPQGQKHFQTLLYAIQAAKPAPSFDPQRFNDDIENFTIYVAGENEDGSLRGFMLEDSRSGTPVIYTAEQARIERVGRQLRFILQRGAAFEGEGDALRTTAFDKYTVAIDLGELGLLKIPKWGSRVFEMGMLELWKQRQKHDSPAAAAEWHRRLLMPAMIWVLFCFALPLSMEPKRSGRTGAYVLGVGLLLLAYNLQIVLHQQVEKEVLPWWMMWAGQLCLLAAGIELMRRTMADRLPFALMQSGEFFYNSYRFVMHAIVRRKRQSLSL
ncbi:MAG: LptF/LptG family permease [Mariprofundaceae bacterium]